ncbi:MAG: J domain-containing protein [Chloroflexi bacterium]|uniref:J domain-containing protein n=1 Tax=Candidatus Chlorohelix allophototropha TaxID=3003348 RepID=A0A8T7LZZ2_9CHLR|nr:J domain-containing protein [Chloroflexota bacterium]WJW66480.1 DnaJ domain-containing protein [Chloroflexota bacterium L227-S17]
MKNYYELLEVNIGAQPEQIKANYRRLAKKFHPDLNPDNPKAADQFLAIQQAYEILGDPQKRLAYDSILQKSATSHSVESEDDWFGVGAYAAAATKTYQQEVRSTPKRCSMSKPHMPRTSYLSYRVRITLQELFRGAKRTINVGQTHTCGRCRGARVLPHKAQTCPRCDGNGFLVSFEILEINIPPGMLPDMSMRIEMRHWIDNVPHPLHMPYATSIHVLVELLPHPQFQIEGRDLYTTVEVPLEVLAKGGEWALPAPEGGELIFKIPAHSLSGETITIRRHGLLKGSSHRRGNLYCKLIPKPQ